MILSKRTGVDEWVVHCQYSREREATADYIWLTRKTVDHLYEYKLFAQYEKKITYYLADLDDEIGF